MQWACANPDMSVSAMPNALAVNIALVAPLREVQRMTDELAQFSHGAHLRGQGGRPGLGCFAGLCQRGCEFALVSVDFLGSSGILSAKLACSPRPLFVVSYFFNSTLPVAGF